MKEMEREKLLKFIHPTYGSINSGDSINWSGDYFDGYHPDGKPKTKRLSGTNKIKYFYNDGVFISMVLDNDKEFLVKNVRTGEIIDVEWRLTTNG